MREIPRFCAPIQWKIQRNIRFASPKRGTFDTLHVGMYPGAKGQQRRIRRQFREPLEFSRTDSTRSCIVSDKCAYVSARVCELLERWSFFSFSPSKTESALLFYNSLPRGIPFRARARKTNEDKYDIYSGVRGGGGEDDANEISSRFIPPRHTSVPAKRRSFVFTSRLSRMKPRRCKYVRFFFRVIAARCTSRAVLERTCKRVQMLRGTVSRLRLMPELPVALATINNFCARGHKEIADHRTDTAEIPWRRDKSAVASITYRAP